MTKLNIDMRQVEKANKAIGSSMNNPAANNDQAGFTGHIKDSATGLATAVAFYAYI